MQAWHAATSEPGWWIAGRVGRTGPPEFGRSHDHLGELRVQGILRHDVPHLQEGGAARQGIQSDQGASLVDPKLIFLQARRMWACMEWEERCLAEALAGELFPCAPSR